MAEVPPAALCNAIMGKLYSVLTSGDETVPKPADNLFSFMSPGLLLQEDSLDFLTQGLTGMVKRSDVEQLVVPGTPAGQAPASGCAVASSERSRYENNRAAIF